MDWKRSAVAAAILATTVSAATPPTGAAEPAEVSADEAVAVTRTADLPSSWTLAGVVMFARHGLRGPQSPIPCQNAEDVDCLDAQSERPWPSFGVAVDNLLPHGYEASRRLGAFFRRHYAAAGLLPAKGCPSTDSAAFLYADDERTAMTAGGLADGMVPNCNVDIVVDDDTYTPADESCVADPKTTREAAAAFVGGSWADVANGDMKRPIAAMDAVVGRFSPAACRSLGLPEGCSLADSRPTRTHPGSIAVASTPAELFLMEYGGGFALRDVAWGRLEKATGLGLPSALPYVNQLHALYYAASNMPTAIGSPAGSKALHEIVDALDEMVSAPDDGKAKVVIYVGHDNTLLNIAGMLGFSWQLDGYAPEQVPPGGAIAFELWRTEGGRPMIRAIYRAQTPQQLRTLATLDADRPPATVALTVAGCDGRHGACPWSRFQPIAEQALDPNCTD